MGEIRYNPAASDNKRRCTKQALAQDQDSELVTGPELCHIQSCSC